MNLLRYYNDNTIEGYVLDELSVGRYYNNIIVAKCNKNII